ncbi:hypothetical protein OH77DRAFT_587893 [Trametes cingulata]|nr:hypothetical protein OH77DRAFT_587893 [Trametes cingulata]
MDRCGVHCRNAELSVFARPSGLTCVFHLVSSTSKISYWTSCVSKNIPRGLARRTSGNASTSPRGRSASWNRHATRWSSRIAQNPARPPSRGSPLLTRPPSVVRHSALPHIKTELHHHVEEHRRNAARLRFVGSPPRGLRGPPRMRCQRRRLYLRARPTTADRLQWIRGGQGPFTSPTFCVSALDISSASSAMRQRATACLSR